jgi:histidine triad (HIT) family protein
MVVMSHSSCVFCRIIRGEIDACRVHEDEHVLVFLDNTPVFAGHCLVCPRQHHELLTELPDSLLAPVLGTARLVARAVEHGLGAEGSFLALNNRISQSVPHLHMHVIPRRKGDGMKGFFWPRRPYRDPEEMTATQRRIQAAITYLQTHV